MIRHLQHYARTAIVAVVATVTISGSAVAQQYPHDVVTLVTHSREGGPPSDGLFLGSRAVYARRFALLSTLE